jgi:hypothetical protein
MKMDYLYVVKGDKDSEEAVKVLEDAHIEFKTVFINEQGNGKFMFRDLLTTQIPSLAHTDTVYPGLHSIKKYASPLIIPS